MLHRLSFLIAHSVINADVVEFLYRENGHSCTLNCFITIFRKSLPDRIAPSKCRAK